MGEKYYIMRPANNVMGAEVVTYFDDKTADNERAAEHKLSEWRAEGDQQDFFIWSKAQYDAAYDARVAPYYIKSNR